MKTSLRLLTALICAGFLSGEGRCASTSTTPLNIVVFLVDDLGVRDAGCYGSTFYETPAMDRLASEGMQFTQAYAAHPRCVPSRYAIMTGKFPARMGVPGARYNIDLSETTLAAALKEGGYATFFAGKWHLSKTEEQLPQNQGFDVNIAGGHAGAPGSYFYPYSNKKGKAHKSEADILGLEDGHEGEYLNDRLTDETLSFMQQHHARHPEQPFFVYLSHYAVHTPLEAKAEDVAYFKEKAAGLDFDGPEFTEKDGSTKMRQDHPVYAAMVKSMDESLGRIRAEIERLGLEDHTLVLVTSDHGGLSNRGKENTRELATSNLPLRAGKGHCYEGGIRVPLIVKWPGVTQPGTQSDEVISGTDHYPTLLAAAGLDLRPSQHLDGLDYRAALALQPFERPAPLFWHSPKGRPDSTGDTNCSVIRQGNLKLLHFYDEDRIELYDISKDPSESTNLSAAEPETTQHLLDSLNRWKNDIGAFEDQKKTTRK